MFKPNETNLYVAKTISNLRNCIIELKRAKQFCIESPKYSYMQTATISSLNARIFGLRNLIKTLKLYY